MEFPSKNTGVGSHSLLQGIFLIQEQNPGLLHCRQILYHLSHQASTLTMHVVELKSSSILPTKGWYLPSTAAAAAAKLLQSHSTLRDPMDCSLPGSSVHGNFQARVLEWVALAFSGHLLLQRIKSQLLWPLTFTTHFKEFRMEIRNEVLCVFWEKRADHVLRWLDVFRRFYKPNSWISSYWEKH